MPRSKSKRPTIPRGFLALKKTTLPELDCLPPGLWRVYIKLLSAASWSWEHEGVLGFSDNPWTLRDIASAIGMDPGNLSKALRELQVIELNHGEWRNALVERREFDLCGTAGYWLPHYDHFVKTRETRCKVTTDIH